MHSSGSALFLTLSPNFAEEGRVRGIHINANMQSSASLIRLACDHYEKMHNRAF